MYIYINIQIVFFFFFDILNLINTNFSLGVCLCYYTRVDKRTLNCFLSNKSLKVIFNKKKIKVKRSLHDGVFFTPFFFPISNKSQTIAQQLPTTRGGFNASLCTYRGSSDFNSNINTNTYKVPFKKLYII